MAAAAASTGTVRATAATRRLAADASVPSARLAEGRVPRKQSSTGP